MGRSYSDPSYGSKKTFAFPATGSLIGTAAIAIKAAHQFMQPVTITDMNVFYKAGGTEAAASFVLGKSLAGTGAFSAIGTMLVGTYATGKSAAGSVTQTSFSTLDEVQLYAGGSSATVADGVVSFQYKETFEVGDS